jgi:plasmid maintenance system antidote protein VapI
MVLIHEKITALLEQRRLKKRDLARALGVSPQTATDICKGRSAITLPHLRNLISYFEVRAEFWLDDDRLAPIEIDQLARRGAAEALMRTGMLDIEDPQHLMERVRAFVQQQRDSFLSSFPDLTAAEQRLLGLADPESGVVGRIGGSEMGAPQATATVVSADSTHPSSAQATAGAKSAEMEGQ